MRHSSRCAIQLSQASNSVVAMARRIAFTQEANRWYEIADIMRDSALELARLENKIRLLLIGLVALGILSGCFALAVLFAWVYPY